MALCDTNTNCVGFTFVNSTCSEYTTTTMPFCNSNTCNGLDCYAKRAKVLTATDAKINILVTSGTKNSSPV